MLRRLLKSGDVTLDDLGYSSTQWKDIEADDGIAPILLSSEFRDCDKTERLSEIHNAIGLMQCVQAARVRRFFYGRV